MIKRNSRFLSFLLVLLFMFTFNLNCLNVKADTAATPKWVIQPAYQEMSLYYQTDKQIFRFQDPKTSLYGFADRNGKIIHKAQFSEFEYDNDNGLMFVKKGQKWGLMDYNGKLLIEPIYDMEEYFKGAGGLVKVRRNGETAYFDIKGNLKYDFIKAEDRSVPSEGLVAISDKNGKWGYTDEKGKILIPCKYDYAGDFIDGLAIVGMRDPKSNDSSQGPKRTYFGYIDKTGKTVIPCKYDQLGNFSDGLAAAGTIDLKSYDKSTGNYNIYYGYIDKTDKMVIPSKYPEAGDFKDGIAIVRIWDSERYRNLSGIINKAGEMIVPFEREYMRISYFNDWGLAAFVKSYGYNGPYYAGFIDKTGKEIIPEHYEPHSSGVSGIDLAAKSFNKDGIVVMGSNGDHWSVYNHLGQKLLDSASIKKNPLITNGREYYEECYGSLINGNLPVYADRYWYLIDLEGNLVSQQRYPHIQGGPEYFYVGTSYAWANWGMADSNFNLLIPMISQYVTPSMISPDVYMVNNDNKYYFIDSKGNEIEPQNKYYSGHYDFYFGSSYPDQEDLMGMLSNDYKRCYVDAKTGKMAIPAIFDGILPFYGGVAGASVGEKWGLINKKGKWIIQPTFERLEVGNENVIPAMKDGKWGLIENPLKGQAPSAWAVQDIEKAKEYGLTTEQILSDFRKNITREEFCGLVVKLYEAISSKKAELPLQNKFKDTSNPEILKANHLGIVSGIGTDKFGPNENVTREQMAVMLNNLLQALNITPTTTAEYVYFSDENQISAWAKSSTQLMNKVGIIKSSGTGEIAPKGNATREQAIIMVKRIFENFR